jgi:ISXO2-like transposase domain
LIINSQPGAIINTDEWGAYNHLVEADRLHVTVCHTPGKRVWAKDEDGDDIRDMHVNASEGFWTGLRNFFRPFPGVNKGYLQQYAAIHEWAHNIKKCSLEFYVASLNLPHEPIFLNRTEYFHSL